jgi:hypothetical protein
LSRNKFYGHRTEEIIRKRRSRRIYKELKKMQSNGRENKNKRGSK